MKTALCFVNFFCFCFQFYKNLFVARRQWLMIIWKAEMRKDHSSRPAWANTLQDPISRTARAKWTLNVVQAVRRTSFSSLKPWVQTPPLPPCKKIWLATDSLLLVPDIQEAEIKRIVVQGQPRQKSKTPSQPISRVWWHVPVILAIQEA
jgi:hypothetical protein